VRVRADERTSFRDVADIPLSLGSPTARFALRHVPVATCASFHVTLTIRDAFESDEHAVDCSNSPPREVRTSM
jgi:hypothetical protein